jgi:DNA-binding IclR family transcriptional regulator
MANETGALLLYKAIRVLKCFTENSIELSMSDIADKLGLPAGTASRILNALASENLLERNRETKKYQLGVYCLRMGRIAEMSGTLRTFAAPCMRALRDRFNETVSLYIRNGKQRVCHAQFETMSALKRSIPLGASFTIAAGASGRCFMAWMPQAEVDELIEDLQRFTENTITDRAEILRLLEQTRRDLFAFSREEREMGVAAAAVPIFNAPDSVCASISIAGPSIRFTEEIVAEMIRALKKTSGEMSAVLCGR